MSNEVVTILGIETSCDETAAAVLTYEEGKPLTVPPRNKCSNSRVPTLPRCHAGSTAIVVT